MGHWPSVARYLSPSSRSSKCATSPLHPADSMLNSLTEAQHPPLLDETERAQILTLTQHMLPCPTTSPPTALFCPAIQRYLGCAGQSTRLQRHCGTPPPVDEPRSVDDRQVQACRAGGYFLPSDCLAGPLEEGELSDLYMFRFLCKSNTQYHSLRFHPHLRITGSH